MLAYRLINHVLMIAYGESNVVNMIHTNAANASNLLLYREALGLRLRLARKRRRPGTELFSERIDDLAQEVPSINDAACSVRNLLVRQRTDRCALGV